jgi:hypothetical protein
MGRQISECLPAWLVRQIAEIETRLGEAEQPLRRSAPGPHDRRDETAAVFGIGGDQPREQPVAFAQSGGGTAAQTEFKGTGAKAPAKVLEEPTRLAPRVTPDARSTDMDMTTAHRRHRSVAPRSAVVISMFAWKAAHAVPPTSARTTKAATTRARPATK